MSSVHSGADATRPHPMGLAVMVRCLRSTALNIGKVLVHAFWTDAMAEIQRAVLYQESFNRLPEPFAVADRFAVAAGCD